VVRKRKPGSTTADKSVAEVRPEGEMTLGDSMRAGFQEVSEILETGSTGFSGIAGLDELLVNATGPGRLTLIAARPGEGKSAVATTSAVHVAAAGRHVQVFLTENRAELFGLAAAALPGHLRLTAQDWAATIERAKKLRSLDIRINDRHRTLEAIETVVRGRVDNQAPSAQCPTVFVDSVHGVTSRERLPTETRADELATITRRFSLLAVEKRLHVVLTAHLTSPDARARERTREAWPSLGDIHDCRALGMIADTVIMSRLERIDAEQLVERAAKPQPLEIVVVKNRGGLRGRTFAWLENGLLAPMSEDDRDELLLS